MVNIIGPNWQLLISLRKVIFIFCIGFLFAEYGGGYAGSGFRYGSNAREFSLAGALIADKTPGFYAFSNPALLQYARSSQFGFSYQAMSLDRSIQSFSFAKNLPPSAGFGLSILRSGTDNIQGRNAMNEPTETLTTQEIQGIISFGVSLGPRMALGINIKAFFANIAPELIDVQSGKGIGWDMGAIYKFHRNLIFGGIIKNLTSVYNWKVTIGEDDRSYEENFPQTIAVGASYTNFKGISIFFQEDMVISPRKYINYRFRSGVEYRLSNAVKFRLGFKQERGETIYYEENNSFNFKLAFGAGVPIKIWQKQYLKMDYALDPGSVGEGFSHLFSFSMEIK